jgi:hypothetical protein
VKKFKETAARFIEDIFGDRSTPMFWSWVGAIAVVFAVGGYVGSENVSFLGIAESREININFERAVEIKTIHVQPGQRVSKGDILLELNQSEIETQLRTLQSQLGRINAELKLRESLSRIVSKKKVATNVVDPLIVERAQVAKEIGLLENQKRSLFVFADIDGVVGAVNFKSGEKAPEFASLMTLSPINPSYIIGYVHESAHSKLEQGQKVKVVSPATGREAIGEVMNVGARIIEIPARLLRIPTIVSWGREVLIKVPEENGFLLSEKVQVKPTMTFDFMPSAKANQAKHAHNEELEIKLPYEISVGEKFEPSGLAWADDLSNFIIVSDEAIQAGAPTLLMMNASGQVSRQVLTIENTPAIDDMESISIDGNKIYVMASHSNTRKGDRTSEREMFVRVARQGLVLKTEASVNLRNLLEGALAQSADPRLASIAEASAQGILDIEGHSVDKGDLYVALKSPTLQRHHGLVLRVKNVDAIFRDSRISSSAVSIYADIDFKGKNSEMQISDLYVKNGKSFVATTCKGDSCSAVWSFSPVAGVSPVQLAFFKHDQLEGITYDEKSNTVTGIFDAGGKPTKMVRIKLK